MDKRTRNLIIVVGLYFILMYILPIFIPNYTDLVELGKVPNWLTAELYSIILNLAIYLILFVSVILLTKIELVEDFQELKVSNKKKDIFINVLIGYILLLFGSSVGNIITQVLGGEVDSANQEAISRMLTSEYGFIMIICVAVIGPIVEEIVFRKTLFKLGDKVKLPRFVTILITSVLFGLIHVTSAGDFVQIFPYIFMGIAMGIVYNISNTILVPTIVHIIQNSISVLSILYLLPLLERLEQLIPQ